MTLVLHGSICPNLHWTLGSVEPDLPCGTCGEPYAPTTFVQVDALRWIAAHAERIAQIAGTAASDEKEDRP
jgi:hypothetical protein